MVRHRPAVPTIGFPISTPPDGARGSRWRESSVVASGPFLSPAHGLHVQLDDRSVLCARLRPGLAAGPWARRPVARDRLRYRLCVCLGGDPRVAADPLLIRAYVEIFRNVPILLWTYFAFYGIGRLGFGVLDNVWSFVLALSLYGGAYLTEVFRAGLGAIPRRYGEAAMAVGLRRFQRIRLVTLPLMFRIVLPSLSNTFISCSRTPRSHRRSRYRS